MSCATFLASDSESSTYYLDPLQNLNGRGPRHFEYCAGPRAGRCHTDNLLTAKPELLPVRSHYGASAVRTALCTSAQLSL